MKSSSVTGFVYRGGGANGLLFAVLAIIFLNLCSGCSSTVSHVALLSVGDLEGKRIPEKVDGPLLSGRDVSSFFTSDCYLSEAVRDALSGTPYDTLVDAEVSAKSGLFWWWNSLTVKGYGFDSKTLPREGVVQ